MKHLRPLESQKLNIRETEELTKIYLIKDDDCNIVKVCK